MEGINIAAASGAFANKLRTELCKKDRNVFFSPLSVHTCLSMLMQGSEDHTKDLMAEQLGVEKESAALGYQALLQKLNEVSDITLHLANKIYVKEGLNMKKSFQGTLTDKFLAEAESIAFDKPDAADTINQWCKDKTNQKIDKLIQPSDLKETTRLILLNAIYFKGAWKNPFRPSSTKKTPFYINKDETIEVDMMYKKDNYMYKFDHILDARIVQIPYKNENVRMVVILPSENDGIKELEKKLSGCELEKIADDMHIDTVDLYLPKFKIEMDIDLVPPLSNMGLKSIFEGPTDFSGILEPPEPLKVDKAKQKAFIEVNEEGSEAAAVTGMMIMKRCMRSPKPSVLFKADHPFMFEIQYGEGPNTFSLFSGRVSDPNKN